MKYIVKHSININGLSPYICFWHPYIDGTTIANLAITCAQCKDVSYKFSLKTARYTLLSHRKRFLNSNYKIERFVDEVK